MFKNVGRTKVIGLAAIAIVCLANLAVFAQDSNSSSPNVSPLASPTGMVNDFAGVIDEGTKQQLETRLRQFKDKTGVELAVAVVRTTGDRPIFDYSLAVARGWKIGSKGDDNPSALLFVAVDDRKYFTQVSADLEDELPDGLAGSLQRQYLVPEFKKGNYAKGIADTMDAYMRTIEQRTSGLNPPAGSGEQQPRGVSQSLYSTFCCFAVILVIALIIWSNRGGGSKSGRGGGGWGGGFGGGGSALPWIIGSMIANSSSSSSSDSSWGSGGGGGSDWGGFGGGGDFGGGGGGGDW